MKSVLSAIGCRAAIAIFACLLAAPQSSSSDNVVRITARKFEFSPATITVKKGEPLVIEIKSTDVRHGFVLSDFRIRAELKPGELSRLTFTPDKTGQFTFACDIFCGAGHEEMSGTLVVTE